MKIRIIAVFVITVSMITEISAQASKAFVNALDAEKAVWTYLYGGCSKEQTIHTTVLSGDTIINGIKWRIITGEPYIEKGLIRTDGKKVLFKPYPGYEGSVNWGSPEEHYNQKDSIVIYDFSLGVGDSVKIRGHKTEIIEIDSITLNDGHKHKLIELENFGYYIEGLGSANITPLFMIYPISTCQYDADPVFICCHVNDELLYINPAFLDCNGTLVSNEIINTDAKKAKIYSDNGQLNVTFDDDALFDVTIYTLQGTVVTNKKANMKVTTIPFSNIPNGVYIVQITSGQNSFSYKFIN